MTNVPDPPSRSTFLDRHGYVVVAAPPILILSAALLLFDVSANVTMEDFTTLLHSLAQHTQALSPARTLAEVRALYIWLFSVVLNMSVDVGALVLCGLMMYRFHSRRRLLLMAVMAAVLCLGGVLMLFQSIAAKGALYQSVFAFTYVMLESSARFSPTFLTYVHSVVFFINGLAVAVPAVVLLTACSTLAPPEDEQSPDIDVLADQMRSLKEILAIGSAVLFTGILHMDNWLRWPAALVGDDTMQEAVLGMALAVSLFWGATFTLLLFATYAPAAGILSRRARELLKRDASQQNIPNSEEWLKEHGFFIGVKEELPQIAAIAAPFLAGPLESLLTAALR